MKIISEISESDRVLILKEIELFLKGKTDYVIGYGSTSTVLGINQYAIKVFNSNRTQKFINREINMYKILENNSLIPKLIFYASSYLVVERIIGDSILDIKHFKKRSKFISENWKDKMRIGLNEIINMSIQPHDLNNLNILIDEEGEPWIVDLGAFEEEKKPNFEVEKFIYSLSFYLEFK